MHSFFCTHPLKDNTIVLYMYLKGMKDKHCKSPSEINKNKFSDRLGATTNLS